MQPVVAEFVRKYKLEDFIVVADSEQMNGDNIADLEANGYKYIIGVKIKNESRNIQEWRLGQPKIDNRLIVHARRPIAGEGGVSTGKGIQARHSDTRKHKPAWL